MERKGGRGGPRADTKQGGGRSRLGHLGFLEQVPRLRRVVGIHAGQIDIAGVGRRKMAADRRSVAKHGAVDDRLAVDGIGHRLADLEVVERLAAVVHGENGLALGRADHDREFRIVLELGQRFRRREIGEGIDVAGLHRRKGRGRIGDELERRLLQRHRRAPVVGVPRKLDVVALDPFDELERPGADRVGGVVVGALRRDDHRVAPAHVEQEIAGGMRQRHPDGRRIDHLDRGNGLEQRLLRVLRVGRPRPVERELDVLGIETRAVMEAGALDQVERVGQAVVRDVP